MMSGLVLWVLLVGDSGVSFGVERPVGVLRSIYQYTVYVLLLCVRLSRANTNIKHVVLVISFQARAEV